MPQTTLDIVTVGSFAVLLHFGIYISAWIHFGTFPIVKRLRDNAFYGLVLFVDGNVS